MFKVLTVVRANLIRTSAMSSHARVAFRRRFGRSAQVVHGPVRFKKVEWLIIVAFRLSQQLLGAPRAVEQLHAYSPSVPMFMNHIQFWSLSRENVTVLQ